MVSSSSLLSAGGSSALMPSWSMTRVIASCSCCMDWKRSSCRFCSVRRMTVSYASGTAAFRSRGRGGGSWMWPMSTSPKAEPGKGSLPVASWNIITPNE